MEGLNIRPAIRADIEQIKTILHSPFVVERYIGKVIEKCYVAVLHDDVVGVLCMSRDGFVFSLDHIEVHPEVRRFGVGTSLIQTLRSAIPDDTSMEADVDIRRHDTIGFLKENGFTVMGRRVDRIYLRNGWRFRVAPDVMYRITPEDL